MLFKIGAMHHLTRALVLVILPTALLVFTGCTEADQISADVTQRAMEVQQGVGNVVQGVADTRDALLEKKRQLEQAAADVRAAIDSVNLLLGGAEEAPDAATTEEATAPEAAAATDDATTSEPAA